MTIIYGEQIDILSIDPTRDVANVSIKMVEANTMAIDEEIVSGTFGGYGGEIKKTLPLKKVLTPQELSDWRFIKWLYRGRAERKQAAQQFFMKVKNTPHVREVRKVAAGGNLVTGVKHKR